jgi:hypothetical protein
MSSSGAHPLIIQGTPGEKGEPGGIVASSLIPAGTDWNTLTVSGLYHSVGADMGGMINKPPTTVAIQMLITARNSNVLTQIAYYVNNGYQTNWQRSLVSGVWGAWRSFTPSRMDYTAGRALYQWDEISNREQLVYGDTGWRVLDLLNGWTGTVHIRRFGISVKCRILNLDGNAATAQKAFDWPAGFAPDAACLLVFANTPAEPARRVYTDIANGFALPVGAVYAGSGYAYLSEFVANGSWPTVLPGIASGTIPNL